MELTVDGKSVREFDVELAVDQPDFMGLVNLQAWRGSRVTIDAGTFTGGANALKSIVQSDGPPDADRIYHEPYQPRCEVK